MRRISHLTAVVATAAALVPALAPPSTALAMERVAVPTTGTTSDESPPVIIDDITPRAVKEKSTVTATGQVTNTTDETLEEVTIRLRYSPHPVGERSELNAHADGDHGTPQKTGAKVDLDEPLAPGEATDFELETDAEDLNLDTFGVYPIAIDGVDGSGDELGIQHTFLPYQGEEEGSDPVDIAWLWPLRDHPQRADDDTYLGEGLTNDLGPEGRLNELLAVGAQDGEVALDPPDPNLDPADAAASDETDEDEDTDATNEDKSGDSDADGDRVPITWTVDPGLLSDINRLTSDSYHVLEDPEAVTAESQPTAQTYDPSVDAAAWIEQARDIIRDDPLVSTPFASADIPALLRNDLENDAKAAMTLGDDVVERVLERPTDPTYAVPPNGVMDPATREFFADHGTERFLLRDAAMPRHDWLDYTPTAQASLPSGDDGGDDGTALVADSRLTRVLGTSSQGPGETALAKQRFAAETALISAEHTDTKRTILASPPSDWNPGAEFAQDVLRSSEELPWLDPVALDDVDDADSSTNERHELTYPEEEADNELSGASLDKITDIRREVRLFNTVLAENQDPFRPAILRAQSAAWRDRTSLGEGTHSLLNQAVTDARSKVRIIESEPVTLASKSGTIGVLVANDLEDETVTVHLSIFSSNSERLSIGDYQDTMEIGPGGKTTVYVPLSARVNGRTVLHMSLQNADGEPVSTEEAQIPVNATGMGTQALLISAVGALVLIIALAPRALRKWARSRARSQETATETGPEPAPENSSGTPETTPDNDNSPSDKGAANAGGESAEPAIDDEGEPATDEGDDTAGNHQTAHDATDTGEDENQAR